MQAQNPAIFVENLQEVFPSHLPCLPGQDIKSDGFSIETCKIMVDMLDVSLHVPPSTQVGGWHFTCRGSGTQPSRKARGGVDVGLWSPATLCGFR